MLASILLFITMAHGVPLNDMGARLIELRATVEEKGRELDLAQREASSGLDPLLQRKTELETQLRKERLRSLQLSEKAKVLKVKSGGSKPDHAREYQALLEWSKNVEASVRASLPFRHRERLERLAGIRRRIEAQTDSPVTLAAELWSFTDGELKMSADNEFVIGQIEMNGQVVDAEIARLGMVQMLFKTSKGEPGYAEHGAEGWTLVAAEDGATREAIARSLKKFKDSNAGGWLEVPGLAARMKVEATK